MRGTGGSGTLGPWEPHPAAGRAKAWLARLFGPTGTESAGAMAEALATTALAGDREAQVGSETLRRLTAGLPVGDRYLLGLAWTVRDAVDQQHWALDCRATVAGDATGPEAVRRLWRRVAAAAAEPDGPGGPGEPARDDGLFPEEAERLRAWFADPGRRPATEAFPPGAARDAAMAFEAATGGEAGR